MVLVLRVSNVAILRISLNYHHPPEWPRLSTNELGICVRSFIDRILNLFTMDYLDIPKITTNSETNNNSPSEDHSLQFRKYSNQNLPNKLFDVRL